jgi:Nif-specific regulatory protein
MKSAGGPVSYRRRAILNRIHSALDAFYLLQKIDWEYDGRTTLNKILALALEELEFEGGKRIERALLIIEHKSGGPLEVEAGWRAEEPERAFSRTVVHQTIRGRQAILCENAKDDPRFMAAESIKGLETLSLISVPLTIGGEAMGALYIESGSPGNVFTAEDLGFLGEFAEAIAPYIKTAITHESHLSEIRSLRAAVTERYSFENIIGRSEAMRTAFELMRLAAGGDRTVLITGESGSGKELVARAIHCHSSRAAGPLIVVDCSGLSEHILESELFGHKKGAFTGAGTDKVGAFEEANGGSIFLDEISDAPRTLQQKLRRVLQEGEIRRVGDNQFRRVDVRVICATNRSLPELVERGEFIRDLYFRINKFPIHIPPLRERREDVPPLVHHFIAQAQKEVAGSRLRVEGIDPAALEALVRMDWSANNIRELRNAVELAVDLSPGPRIELATVEKVLRIQRGKGEGSPAAPAAGKVAGPADCHGLLRIERERFHQLLEASAGEAAREGEGEGHVSEAAPEAQKEPPKGDGGGRPGEAPFSRIYQEFAARTIIEGLRTTGWKLRPAARLLGISPMKLRGELKGFLTATLERVGGDYARAAEELEIPAEILVKKASDFGIAES